MKPLLSTNGARWKDGEKYLQSIHPSIVRAWFMAAMALLYTTEVAIRFASGRKTAYLVSFFFCFLFTDRISRMDATR